jgi:hypothetical protein
MKGSEGTRLAITVALMTLLLAAAGWWGFERFIRARPDPGAIVTARGGGGVVRDAGTPQDPKRPEARIVSVKGEVRRGATAGEWTPVREGDTLREHERIRTGAGGSAELSVDEKSSVLVSESTEVGVEEISRAVHRFRLMRGRVTADYAPDGRRALRIEGTRGQAAETSRDARFSVLATEETFTLATERGKVNLASAGAEVTVEAGRQASATAEKAPAAPTPIPAEVLLLATGKAGPAGCSEVGGTAPPGSEVTVAGIPAVVDADGRFRVKLTGEVAQKKIAVWIRDAAGHIEKKQIVCAASTSAQRVRDIEIRGWHSRPR